MRYQPYRSTTATSMNKLGKMTKEEYNEALSKGEKMNRPMIVVEDRETGAIVAHMCSQKGPGDK